jgi:hypothetical protein
VVSLILKSRFFPDWDARWRSDRYQVVYRIGEVEEAFSFTPTEIDDAIEAAAGQVGGQMARARLDAGRSPGLEGLIDLAARLSQNIIEIMVRRKHGLEMVLDENLFPRPVRRAIKSLIKGAYVPRSALERSVRSAMVFGLMMWFLGKPADHDHLEVTDRSQAELDVALEAGSVIMNPGAKERLEALGLSGFGSLGGRTIGSSRAVIN